MSSNTGNWRFGRCIQDLLDATGLEGRYRKSAALRLFAGSALAGQHAAVAMSLVQSAKLNGMDSWACLRDVLARIQSHPSHRLDELLPHRWRSI